MNTMAAQKSKTVLNFNKSRLQDTTCLETSEYSCSDVQEIHMCFNYVSELSGNIFSLYGNLTNLSVACNNLTAIPSSLSTSCPRLRCLRAPNNQITSLPDLRGMDSLECLDLRYNNITILDSLLPLSGLKEFSVSANKIHTINWSQVPVFPRLHFLGIYSNQLCDFEDVIQGLNGRTQNLKCLNIGCNPFCQNRQLSLVNALLTTKHLSSVQVGKLFTTLGQVFASTSEEKCNKSLSGLKAEVEASFAEFSIAEDSASLKRIATVLLRLKLTLPHLERVDENNLPRIES